MNLHYNPSGMSYMATIIHLSISIIYREFLSATQQNGLKDLTVKEQQLKEPAKIIVKLKETLHLLLPLQHLKNSIIT